MNLYLRRLEKELKVYVTITDSDRRNRAEPLFKKIERYAKRCNIVVEGDVVSAFNHVDHHILLNILKKKFKDKKFLRLIWKMLKSGIMDGKEHQHTLKGTPQGGIVSPLLFNIYLLGFDEYVFENVIEPILAGNKKKVEEKKKTKRPKLNLVNEALKRKKKILSKKLKALKDKHGSYKTEHRSEAKAIIKQIKKYRNESYKIPSQNVQELPKGALYVRYADD